MGKVIPVQEEFRRMVRDFPRNQLPKGACWTMEDWIPIQLGAPARKRGGYRNYSDLISATVATTSYVTGGIYADQLATPKMVVVDEDGRLIQIKTDGTGDVVDIGAGLPTLQNPVQLNALVVNTGSDGTTAPKRYNGSAVANLGGSPPAAKYAAVWKALLLLGNTAAQPQRLYFSTTDYNPETWDPTNTYWDFSYPIKGLGPMRNAVLVFADEYTSRLRGSTPPPGGDLIADDPLFNIGCADARSIATWNEQTVWAAHDGIYITDGTIPNDLTKLCGMKGYWQDALNDFDNGTGTITAGIIRDFYVVSVMVGAAPVLSAMIDLQRYGWVNLSNVDASSIWRVTGGTGDSEQLFFGPRNSAYVGEMSTFFSPNATYKNDGNGMAVTPMLETPYYEISQGRDRIRRVYLTYDLRDDDGDLPTISIKFVESPEETSYTAVDTDFNVTVIRDRQRKPIGKLPLGIGFKIEQTNASSDTRLWALGLEGHGREQSHL